MRHIAIAISLVLAGCVSAEALRTEPVALTDQQRQAIQARVAAAIPDSQSAVFGPVMEARRRANGDTLVCGGVKFRNRMGGMEDTSPFIVLWPAGSLADSARVQAIGNLDASVFVVFKTCNDFGLLR
jgi:hypothetical protein